MIRRSIFSTYFNDLAAVARRGDAREESFYRALEDMLKEAARATGRTHVHVTTLPRPTAGGNPDFRVWNGTDRIIGYIEAKKPTEERLDIIEDSEQLQRYRSTFPNLILTNFLEFRLYRNGVRAETVLAGRPMMLNTLRITPPLEKPNELYALLDHFLDFALPKTVTAESLAVQLAKRTRHLRDVIGEQCRRERVNPGSLSGFFEAFQTYLIGSLKPDDFADLFAQTITYGLCRRPHAHWRQRFQPARGIRSHPTHHRRPARFVPLHFARRVGCSASLVRGRLGGSVGRSRPVGCPGSRHRYSRSLLP